MHTGGEVITHKYANDSDLSGAPVYALLYVLHDLSNPVTKPRVWLRGIGRSGGHHPCVHRGCCRRHDKLLGRTRSPRKRCLVMRCLPACLLACHDWLSPHPSEHVRRPLYTRSCVDCRTACRGRLIRCDLRKGYSTRAYGHGTKRSLFVLVSAQEHVFVWTINATTERAKCSIGTNTERTRGALVATLLPAMNSEMAPSSQQRQQKQQVIQPTSHPTLTVMGCTDSTQIATRNQALMT
jgi:hypothetical protein